MADGGDVRAPRQVSLTGFPAAFLLAAAAADLA